MQKVKNKLVGWKANTLSKVSVVTLIKSNLFGIPNYVMYYVKCTTRLHGSLNEECMNFFWGSDTNMNHVAWNKVCSRKATRGLGIRRLDHINNASPLL